MIEIIAALRCCSRRRMLWLHRERLSRHDIARRERARASRARSSAPRSPPSSSRPRSRTSRRIAAIVGSGLGPARQLSLLVLFNVCFVLPLIGIVCTLTFAGEQAERMLAIGRGFLQRHWPAVLAGLMLFAGVFVILLGVTGFTSSTRGRLGRLSRHLRRLLHLQ